MANFPPFFPNLQLWLKSDEGVSIQNNVVPAWADLSGNGRNATQPTVANQPAFRPNYFPKGQPAIRTDGSNDYLSFSRPVQDSFSIYCLFNAEAATGAGANWWENSGVVDGETPGLANDFGMSMGSTGIVYCGNGQSPGTDITAQSGSGLFNQILLVEFLRNSSNGNCSLVINQRIVSQYSNGTTSLTTPAVMTMGCLQTLGNFGTFNYGEVLIYSELHDPWQRTQVERYFAQKYPYQVYRK